MQPARLQTLLNERRAARKARARSRRRAVASLLALALLAVWWWPWVRPSEPTSPDPIRSPRVPGGTPR